MICSCCNAEMEKGFIYAKKDLGIPWIPESESPPIIWTMSSVEAHNGIMLSEPFLLSPKHCTLEVWVCRKCKIGIFEINKP